MPEGQKKSRLESYKGLDENSLFLRLPSLDGADYLVGLLFEAGLTQSTGMGVHALSWSEIDSWLRVTQARLNLWEILTIKKMSEVYAGELGKATKRDYPAPYVYTDNGLISDREAITRKVRNVFASFKKKKPEPK